MLLLVPSPTTMIFLETKRIILRERDSIHDATPVMGRYPKAVIPITIKLTLIQNV